MLRQIFNRVLRESKESDQSSALSENLLSLDSASIMKDGDGSLIDQSLRQVLTLNSHLKTKKHVKQPFNGIYVCKLLSTSGRELIIKELRNKDAKYSTSRSSFSNKSPPAPLTFNDFGCLPIIKELVETVFKPIISACFLNGESAKFPFTNAYLVDIFPGSKEIGLHTDSSDFTVNICLGGEFEGSEQYFQGRRCKKHLNTWHRPEEHYEHTHQPGFALIHRGSHRSGVYSIRKGRRRNLLVFLKHQPTVTNDVCSEWCGEHEALHIKP